MKGNTGIIVKHARLPHASQTARRHLCPVALSTLTLALGAAWSGAAQAQQYVAPAGATTSQSNVSYTDNNANQVAVVSSGSGTTLNITNGQITANGTNSAALTGVQGGVVNFNGGSITIGNTATRGNQGAPSPTKAFGAVSAYDGGSVSLTGGVALNLGTSPVAGTTGGALGNALGAYSDNGSTTSLILNDVNITAQQLGYAGGANSGSLGIIAGQGASLTATNLTTNVNTGLPVNGGFIFSGGASGEITNSNLQNTHWAIFATNQLNASSASANGASSLDISNSTITSAAPVGGSMFMLDGIQYAYSGRPMRVSATLTNDTVVDNVNSASSPGLVYWNPLSQYNAIVTSYYASDAYIHGGSYTTTADNAVGFEATDASAGRFDSGYGPNAGTITIDAVGATGPTTVVTQGAGAYAAYANLGGQITIDGANITTHGANANALEATLADAQNPQISAATVTSPTFINMTGGTVTTYGTGADGAYASGNNTSITLTGTSVTVNGTKSTDLYATAGGTITMHGGSATMGDGDTVVGYGLSPAVYAYNGGTITLDQGARVNIGQSAGTNALGNGVSAYSTNGSATTVNLDDVTITHNQNGYVSGNTGRYMSATGAGASLVANNVTTDSATIQGQPVNGIVAVESGAQMTITHSSLNQAYVYNLASGTSGPATRLAISDTTIGSPSNAIGVLGSSWSAANAIRGSTALTNVSVALGGSAGAFGGVYGSGIYGAGVMADTTSDVAVHGGSITTAGTHSMGVEATDNSAGVAQGGAGAVTVDAVGAQGPTRIQTSGAEAYGLYANLGGQITASDAVIATSGASADGVRATLGDALNPGLSTASVNPAAISMTGGSVTTTGSNANGVSLDGGTSVTLAGVAVNASGHGVSITDANATGKTNAVTISGGSLAAGGDAFAVNAANAHISVSGTSPITPGSGNILNLTNGGSTTFTASGETLNGNIMSDASSTGTVSLLNGTVLTGQVDPVSMTLDGTSAWNVTANSSVNDLTNGGTITYGHDASSNPLSASSYKTVTVSGNYVGNGGTVALNTYLGDSTSPTDQLIVNGGAASGTSALKVSNTAGAGAQTSGDGIPVIVTENGGTTGASAFHLAGPVQAGAYEYLLYRGGQANANDWYLRSQLASPGDTTGSEPAAPGAGSDTGGSAPAYRPGAVGYAMAPLLDAEYGFAMLGKLHERVGDIASVEHKQQGNRDGVWGRLGGQSIDANANDRFATDARTFFAQFGKDWTFERSGGGSAHAGVTAAFGSSNASFTDAARAQAGLSASTGTAETHAQSIGGYWTRYLPDGTYFDSVGQLTHYSNDYSDSYGDNASQNGFGVALSQEVGKPFALGNTSIAVEPQAQLMYQYLKLNGFSDSVSDVSGTTRNALRGRVGVRVFRQNLTTGSGAGAATPYFTADVLHDFLPAGQTVIGGTPFDLGLARTWYELGVGVTASFGKSGELYANAKYARNLGGAYQRRIAGQVGYRYSW